MERFLNGATIMSTSTPRSLEIARATGFAGIEARAERLLDDRDEVAATAAAARVGEVWSLNGVRLPLTEDGRLERGRLVEDLEARLHICRAIGAAYLLAVPPRRAELEEPVALPGIRQALELARDRSAAAGIRIAFEFLGFADCPIASPRAAAAAVAEVPDVDLVLDSCHWHASGSEPLDGFPVERLVMVHLNDAPSKPRREIEDADRVFPGLGVIKLAELVTDLLERGYDGPWSLETFNPGYWETDPLEVVRHGAEALDRLLLGS